MSLIAEALTRAVDALEEAGVEYAITGSFAMSCYGYPRATLDVDIKIGARDLDERLERIAREMRVREFQYMEPTSFLYRGKFLVELYPATNALDEEALARRVALPLLASTPRTFGVVTLEDLLLIKIREYALHRDPKHVSDARHLLVANHATLDARRLHDGLMRHKLLDAWKSSVEPGT